LFNSIHASASLNAPVSASIGRLASAAFPTPGGVAVVTTMGFALQLKQALAIALATLGSLSVSAVIMQVSPGSSFKSSLQRTRAA
jgi:hypothetical protein